MIQTAHITHIQVGRRTLEKENIANNWEPLDINNLKIPQNKCVFMFGGNTTTRPEAGNGNIKIIQSLISADQVQKTNLYSFVYETEPYRSESVFAREYQDDALLLYEKTFKPILFDNKGNMKEMKGIEQAFSKIVFASHCGGSNFVNIIVDELYNTLTQKYPPNTASLLISKIQYFAYAPHEVPSHNLNALIITPYSDPSFSWSKALNVAETQKFDIDYPKGVIKKLLKAKQQIRFKQEFDSEFQQTRGITFKAGHSIYLIPHRMNPRISIGDHSIECIAKPQFLNSGTDLQETARIANYASKLFFCESLSNSTIDTKKLFNKISERIEQSTPEYENIF